MNKLTEDFGQVFASRLPCMTSGTRQRIEEWFELKIKQHDDEQRPKISKAIEKAYFDGVKDYKDMQARLNSKVDKLCNCRGNMNAGDPDLPCSACGGTNPFKKDDQLI